jgi:hypothetical protein
MNNPKSASVAFEDTWQHESVALYASDNGDELLHLAENFCKGQVGDMSSQEAMFDFCMYIADLRRTHYSIPEDLYFGMDGDDGDNSALGHHIILLVSGQEKFKQNIHDEL